MKLLNLTYLCLASSLVAGTTFAQESQEKRKHFLDEILQINVKEDHRANISLRITPQDSTWLDWLHRSGELPPDFDKMESHPFLPDPLISNQNGKKVKITTPESWESHRKEIKETYQYWVSGHRPPAPDHFQSKLISSHKEGEVQSELVEITFGPNNEAKMTIELIIPEGEGPFPVYMTQWTHRCWAQLAVKRGYMACVYAGADDKDDTQAYQALYPDYDFTCLMRRAWGASRAIDYLYTRNDIDTARIAITGHSRNGKQSLWAAAFDERIKAVISSSCGTGGITPWRYSDPQYCNQTLDDITANAAHWFHPRLRFFFGREDKLPTDQNLLLSLIAPRPLLLHYSIVEGQLNPWANEQCYESAKTVYDLLNADEHIQLFPRMGEHPVATRDLETCIDFLDIQFERKNIPWTASKRFYKNKFLPNAFPKPSEWNDKDTKKPIHVEAKKDMTFMNNQKNHILHALNSLLGKEPGGIRPNNTEPVSSSYRMDWIEKITGYPIVKNTERIMIAPYTSMGDHLSGSIYVPKNKLKSGEKIPVVIYLHQYAFNHGYAYGYNPDLGPRGNSILFQHFTDKGFAVMAIDMLGFGTRIEEAENFYLRYPKWSKMGKMISDTRACIDAISTLDYLDDKNIFILGNTIGGTVGLMTAALDERVTAIAAVSSVLPWRTSNSQYESIRTLSYAHDFIPRLGGYADTPEKVPVDYEEILSCIAPRPLLIIAPTLDRYADNNAIKKCTEKVYSIYNIYGQTDKFRVLTPQEINRITWNMADNIVDYFQKQIK